MIEIKSRWDSSKVLYVAKDAADIRQALEEAVEKGADLRGAYLRGADLGGAYLRGADLRGADLGGANLRGANLRDADLRDADLRDAYLRGADLRGADLRGADLRDADLRDANLRGADLRGAYLRGADLGGAYLRGADLRGADLGGAADWRHPFWATRLDMFAILDQAPAEVAALRKAMVAGKINGSTYSDGECGCLCGTIGIVHAGSALTGAVDEALEELGVQQDSWRPAEQWFIAIAPGDKPLDVTDESIDWSEQSEGVFRISHAKVWLDEWVASRKAIAKALAPKKRKAAKKKAAK